MKKHKHLIFTIDLRLISFFETAFVPFARFSLFLVFFWFGFIKLLGVSPASPLAENLVDNMVGPQYFDILFLVIALIEAIIGLLFLLPRSTRVVIPLLLLHMLIVCSPLVLLPQDTWQTFLVPTLEGQYIIKNAVIVAVAIGIAASTVPLTQKRTSS